MLALVEKDLTLKKKINIMNRDDEILEELPFTFKIGNKGPFKIDEYTPYQYKIFSVKFVDWLRRFKKAYPTIELIKDFNEYKINAEFINQKINDINFIYLTYELFKISCYTELYDYEVKRERMSELDKYVEDSKIKKFFKRMKKVSIMDFKYFYRNMKRSQISLLFFILLAVNVIGFEKKNRLIIEETEKFLKIKLPSIWQYLTGSAERSPEDHLAKDKNGEIIYVDFQKSKPLY